MSLVLYLTVGMITGVISGAFGIGGGIIMVPAFVMLFGLTQQQAQGTALAVMLPPVFILSVLRYYWAGNVKVHMAVFIAMGFVFGALLGANMVQNIPETILRRVFGILIIVVGLKMVLMK